MTEVQRDTIMQIIVGTAIVAVLLVFAAEAENIRCKATWMGSGMLVEWRVFAGCLVQTAEGRWIPASHYRELP